MTQAAGIQLYLLLLINVNIAGIIENITEFRPEMCIEVAKQGFIQWILKRLKVCKSIRLLNPFFLFHVHDCHYHNNNYT